MDLPVFSPAELGQALRRCRKRRGQSQGELAAALGVTQSKISGAERHTGPMSVQRLMQLMQTLGLQLVVRDPGTAPAPPPAPPED